MTATDRSSPPLAADETTTLLRFLDFHRDTLRLKSEGLDAEQLRRPLPPSDLTLGGLLKHLAFVESYWSSYVFLGREQTEPWSSADWDADRDWEWHSAAQDSPEQLRALYDAEVAAADQVLRAADDLDALAVRPRGDGQQASLRWILVHLVEEYARHNGHADLIRQSIDGTTGT